jgi:hypothetical protein
MSSDDSHAVLVEALEAGGYAPAAISNARVAASRGLGARTTRELVEAADPAAGKIAAAIFGSVEEAPAPLTEEQGVRAMDDWIRAEAGFGPAEGGE